MDNLARQAEDAASKGEQGKVYKITRVLSGKRKITTVAPIADKQGKLLTTEVEQDARWAEHFSEILNRQPPLVEANIQETETDLDISTGPPTRGEIIAAIKTLKTGVSRSV